MLFVLQCGLTQFMANFLIILLAIAIFPSTQFTVATAAMTITTEIEDNSCKKLKRTDDLADANIPSQSVHPILAGDLTLPMSVSVEPMCLTVA
jgi:hypothetical protein